MYPWGVRDLEEADHMSDTDFDPPTFEEFVAVLGERGDRALYEVLCEAMAEQRYDRAEAFERLRVMAANARSQARLAERINAGEWPPKE